MIDHYNAFISYKHAPEDIKVAETVQKELEHFHIPSKIRKITGMKRIEKIFRDKNELPITSNLTETISFALEHSDYLIVICSTRTKESVWVQREIEYFLRNHSKRQILTVLVDGEPQDVIPEILQYEDHRIQDSTGHIQYVRTPIEPLSCDYRMSFRKANKIELPRLASALIGCSYDELMNRRRQYAIRRTAIAFSVFMLAAVAFSLYLVQSRNKIKAAYIESLRSQSKYLAKESQSLYENEERITALQLALEALPKDKNDERPVTPEAIRAITDASLSYVSYTGVNIAAAWNYTTSNTVSEFRVSPDGAYLAAIDFSGSLYLWETDTHKKSLQLPATFNSPLDIAFFGPNILGIIQYEAVYAYDIKNKKLNWTYTLEGDQRLYTMPLIEVRDDSAYFLVDTGIVKKINIKDGSEEASVELIPQTNEIVLNTGISGVNISPDEKKIAYIKNSDWTEYNISILDVASNKTISTETTKDFLKSLFWADNEHLMCATTDDVYNSSFSVSTYSVLSDDHIRIRCINPADLKTIWSDDFICNDTMINCNFIRMPNTAQVAYFNGNIAEIYDLKSGKRLFRHNLNSPIVGMYFKNNNKTPIYITHDGGLGTPYLKEELDTIAKLNCFSDEIMEAEVASDGYYICRNNSNEITFYGKFEYDKDWHEIDSSIVIPFFAKVYANDNIIAFMSGKYEDNPVNTIYNLKNYEDVIQIPVDKESSDYEEIIYGDSEYFYTLHTRETGVFVSKTELKSGKSSETQICECGKYDISDIHISKNGTICFIYQSEDNLNHLEIYSIKDGTTESCKIDCPDNTGFGGEPIYYEEINTALICDYNTNLYLINTKDESTTKVDMPDSFDSFEHASTYSCELGILISDFDEIFLLKTDGTVTYAMGCASKPVCYEFYTPGKDKKQEPQIVALFENGDFNRYDARNGHFIGTSQITVKGYGSPNFEFYDDTNQLFIIGDSFINIIDTEYWIETASINNCYGYDRDDDRFITINSTDDSSNYRVGYFKHYTLEDLIQKAEDYLQGSTLSDEQKSEYGITFDTEDD